LPGEVKVPRPIFFMTQRQAINHIQSMLKQRGIKVEPGFLQVVEQPCMVLERNDRSIAVDPSSGIWIGKVDCTWECIDHTCTVSGALQAIEFLIETER
jgi:hypothetical protein